VFVCLKKKLSMHADSVPPYIDAVILYKRKFLLDIKDPSDSDPADIFKCVLLPWPSS